jgi:hypothetical protein
LPCSAVTTAASSSARSFKISRNANSTPLRWDSEDRRQSTEAARAVATACSTSASEASATEPLTSPVAGLCTDAVRSEVPSYVDPLIQWLMVVVTC